MGPIFDRTQERLGASDRGIVMLRRMLFDNLVAVERGDDPQGLIRDPSRNECVDLEGWIAERGEAFALPGSEGRQRLRPREEVFNERHEIVDVPYGAARPR